MKGLSQGVVMSKLRANRVVLVVSILSLILPTIAHLPNKRCISNCMQYLVHGTAICPTGVLGFAACVVPRLTCVGKLESSPQTSNEEELLLTI